MPKREKKRNAVVGRVRFQTSKTSSRDKKAERSIIAILPDVRACLLLLEKWICFRERVALNATSFVWFPIVERAHTRATFDDDDEGHRDDATSKHASVEKRVLCAAAASRVR